MRQGLIIDEYGNKKWYRDDKLHRADGPAIECANGGKEWYIDGDLHRIDGPAIEDAYGGRFWYVNNKRHREYGPACEWINGNYQWYVNGKCHRQGEPAIKYKGLCSYYYNDIWETRSLNIIRERSRIEDSLTSIKHWLPIETSGHRFPLTNMITNYVI
jgi:hypothetical protein